MGLFDWFSGSNVLYFPGCTALFKYKEGYELYKEIFNLLGIKFVNFEDLGLKRVCCGLEAWEAGYDSDARKIMRRNAEVFREGGFDKVITTSPGCYKMFLENYPEVIPDWDVHVENIWGLILARLRKKSKLVQNKAMEIVTFHDNCYLGRHCDIYDDPREILEAIGYEVKEMVNSRGDSFCCGSCGALKFSDPKLADKVARERVLQAKRIGVRKMIVVGFDNYDILKRNVGDSGVEVFEMSEVLAHALGIKAFEEKGISEEPIKGEEDVLEIVREGEVKILDEAKANMRLREELKEEDYYDGSGDEKW